MLRASGLTRRMDKSTGEKLSKKLIKQKLKDLEVKKQKYDISKANPSIEKMNNSQTEKPIFEVNEPERQPTIISQPDSTREQSEQPVLKCFVLDKTFEGPLFVQVGDEEELFDVKEDEKVRLPPNWAQFRGALYLTFSDSEGRSDFVSLEAGQKEKRAILRDLNSLQVLIQL